MTTATFQKSTVREYFESIVIAFVLALSFLLLLVAFLPGWPTYDIASVETKFLIEPKTHILLVDTLYDQRVRLILSAEAAPDKLYHARSGTEAFEFSEGAGE